MEDAGLGADIGTLIIVENFVEADDLRDAFERFHLGPVVRIRSVEHAQAILAETRHRPQLVVLGVTPDADTAQDLLMEQHLRGARILVLNGPPPEVEPLGIAHLSRPYAEDDLNRAIRQLMS